MATLREATASERRRIGVAKRLTGSKWYRSSHTACVYPVPKRETLADAYAANRRQKVAELGRPSRYPLKGDGEKAAKVTRGRNYYRTSEELSVALAEARYADWFADRNAALSPFAAVVALLGAAD